MAVTLYLYSVTAENNKLNKTLGTSTTFSGTFKTPLDIMNPEFIIETPTATISAANMLKKNYLRVGNPINRYYFITNIIIENNTLIRIQCHEDVLMTYNTEIKAMKGIMDRQENYYNLYLNDPELKKLSYPLIQVKAFPNMIQSSDYHFFVITAGG